MENTYRIHLFFEEHGEIDFLGCKLSAPERLRYGHVYCMLDKNGDCLDIGIQGWEDEKKNPEWWDLRGWFKRAMNAGHVRHLDTNTLIVHDEDNGAIASFTISEEDYNRVRENALARLEDKSPYNRLTQNCVKYAADDLRLAGINAGSGFGYTAGRFFAKVRAMSEGNLLYLEKPLFPQIQIIERTEKFDPSRITTTRTIVLDVENFFDEPD